MGEILKGATLIDWMPTRVERADLRIEGNRIMTRAPEITPEPWEKVVDLSGKYIVPGLVVAHTHLYSALARGMPPPKAPPKNFAEILERIWWKLDRCLDEQMVELSAMAGAAEALRCGVTTVFDHHASPTFIEGSLNALRRGLDALGLRGVVCYEITDRNGEDGRDAGLRESESFLQNGQTARVKGMVGGHASFTLEDESLAAMVDLARRYDVGVHVHAAEDPIDDRESRRKFGKGVMERLSDAGVLTAKSVLAHCNHLSWEELSQAYQTGTWLIHNPRSNMNNCVGYAPAGRFGARRALGTDGIGADMIAEAQIAYFRSSDAGAPIQPLHWLGGGHTLATEAFGVPIGPLEQGSIADLVVLDYPSPTPLTADNLTGHLVYGLSSSYVDAVMCDGLWRLWARQVLSLDVSELQARAREAAQVLWSRMDAL